MRDDGSGVQSKKALVGCLVAWPGGCTLSQVIDMMIKYEEFVAEGSYKSGVRTNSHHYPGGSKANMVISLLGYKASKDSMIVKIPGSRKFQRRGCD